jgi:hypothetical protein
VVECHQVEADEEAAVAEVIEDLQAATAKHQVHGTMLFGSQGAELFKVENNDRRANLARSSVKNTTRDGITAKPEVTFDLRSFIRRLKEDEGRPSNQRSTPEVSEEAFEVSLEATEASEGLWGLQSYVDIIAISDEDEEYPPPFNEEGNDEAELDASIVEDEEAKGPCYTNRRAGCRRRRTKS